MSKRIIFFKVFLVALTTSVIAQVKTDISNRTIPRIEEIIKSMSLEEKLDMLVGSPDGKGFKGIPRLGINDLLCQDGPRGPHVESSTAFPTGINFGATWNPALIAKAANAMALEGKAQNVGVLLGPSLNILRDPLGGRFFEYYTEDPFLNSKITASFVTGFQSEQVVVCLKHYAANNREYNRNSYQSMVDERTLREIYLPAFKAGVDAGALTVMTGANGVNGELSSDNKHLLQDILKDDWGFKGFVLTDWCQTISTEKAALAGLDVSMPYNVNSPFDKSLLNAVKKGKVPIELIDDKVRRILYVFDHVGLLDKKDITKDVKVDAKADRAIAKQIASESIVLLKNSKNILPLNSSKIKKIVVLGPNAKQRFCVKGLGGSSWVEAVEFF
jgi:beta-glucosidase